MIPEDERRPEHGAPSHGSTGGDRADAQKIDQDAPEDNDPRVIVRRTASLLFTSPGAVVEIRAIKVTGVYGKGIKAGYFDDPEKFVEAALSLDGKAKGIYVTLNIVKPELLGRAFNRLESGLEPATADGDILRRQYLLIDCDPKRPSNTSSSDDELAASKAVAEEVFHLLHALGFPVPAGGMSGNGYHLLYRIDLSTNDDGLIQRVLGAIAWKVNTDQVAIDTGNYNAARITKLYGTLACKGDAVPEGPNRVARPHRRSTLHLPKDGLVAVPRELLEKVAALGPPKIEEPKATGVKLDWAKGVTLDVDAMLARASIQVSRTGSWKDGKRWVLEVCPFNAQHTDGSAFIVQFGNGALAAGCHHNGCQGKGWRDLRVVLEPTRPESPDGRSGGFVGTSSAGTSGFSSEPEQLPDELLPVAKFDPGLLPERLSAWVVDIAERIQCPLDFPAVAAMVALAAVVGRKLGIRPKRHDDWLVIPNLWGAVIGRPGVLKTPAITEPLKPLKQLELAGKKQFEEDEAKRRAEAIVQDARQKQAKREIQEALQEKDNGRADQLAAQLAASEPKQPVRRRYIVNDSTVEKLGELLNENPNGVLVFRDELIGQLKSLDKEGQEGARAFYLEAWNGTGRYTYDRISRGTIDIEAAIVSILGGIQPGPLRTYLHHAVSNTEQDDGLLQRYQLAVWPDIDREWRNVDRWPNSEARQGAFELFIGMDKLDVTELGAETDGFEPDGIPFLHFDAAAQKLFDDWREELEGRIRGGDEHPAVESHLAKFRSLIPSLALLIHLAEVRKGPVGEAALTKAIAWGKYLETHARRIYSVVANPEITAARALATKILTRKVKDGFTRRDVYRAGWAYLNTNELVERAAGVLIDHGWLLEHRETTGGAPKTTYKINPKVWASPPSDDAPKNVHSGQSPTDKTDGSPGSDPSVGSGGSAASQSDHSAPAAGAVAESAPKTACADSDPTDKTDRSRSGDTCVGFVGSSPSQTGDSTGLASASVAAHRQAPHVQPDAPDRQCQCAAPEEGDEASGAGVASGRQPRVEATSKLACITCGAVGGIVPRTTATGQQHWWCGDCGRVYPKLDELIPADRLEAFHRRASALEFDAGLGRSEAEQHAQQELFGSQSGEEYD